MFIGRYVELSLLSNAAQPHQLDSLLRIRYPSLFYQINKAYNCQRNGHCMEYKSKARFKVIMINFKFSKPGSKTTFFYLKVRVKQLIYSLSSFCYLCEIQYAAKEVNKL